MVKNMLQSDFKSAFELGTKALNHWGQEAYNSCAPVDVLDFFCCAGGMSLGFAVLKNYFKIIGGIDINPISLAAYQDNYHVPTLQADIATLGEDIKKNSHHL